MLYSFKIVIDYIFYFKILFYFLLYLRKKGVNWKEVCLNWGEGFAAAPKYEEEKKEYLTYLLLPPSRR